MPTWRMHTCRAYRHVHANVSCMLTHAVMRTQCSYSDGGHFYYYSLYQCDHKSQTWHNCVTPHTDMTHTTVSHNGATYTRYEITINTRNRHDISISHQQQTSYNSITWTTDTSHEYNRSPGYDITTPSQTHARLNSIKQVTGWYDSTTLMLAGINKAGICNISSS